MGKPNSRKEDGKWILEGVGGYTCQYGFYTLPTSEEQLTYERCVATNRPEPLSFSLA